MKAEDGLPFDKALAGKFLDFCGEEWGRRKNRGHRQVSIVGELFRAFDLSSGLEAVVVLFFP